MNIGNTFGIRKPIIGMIHIFEGERKKQLDQALKDLNRLELYVSGVIVENYDCGYLDSNLATEKMAETIAGITRELVEIAVVPVGLNVLPNDYEKAFSIAGEVGASFIQLDHVTGEFVGCRSVEPRHLLAIRQKYPDIALLGGIHPKYYQLVNPDTPIAESATWAMLLADAVVVTGEKTGGETKIEDLKTVKKAVGYHPVFVGSGLNVNNAQAQLAIADGAIVGTAFKKNGVVPGEPIDVDMVINLMTEVEKVRQK